MNCMISTPAARSRAQIESTKMCLESITDDLLASLPDTGKLSASERRGIIARYASVLEGNLLFVHKLSTVLHPCIISRSPCE